MLQETPPAEWTATESGGETKVSALLQGRRVIICEDEAVIQVQLNRILSLAGLEVVARCVDGKDGVEMTCELKPDIVLMDLNMPKIDGMEAARRIIEDCRPCVVIISAYGDAEFRKRAREIGVCGYITKPIASDSLITQLESIYSDFGTKSAS